MQTTHLVKNATIKGEDISRWLIFTGFWGSILYLLAWVSWVAGSRRQPAS